MCKKLSDIFDIVNDQPQPSVFFKSAMELDFANMVSLLTFDSRSIGYLLQDEFSDCFKSPNYPHHYPLFYKNKIQKGSLSKGKYIYRNAIENALRNN